MKSDFYQHQKVLEKGLPSTVLITGDEPLQKEYILKTIRKLAIAQQYEIERHSVENKLEAEWLFSSSANLSLFGEKKLYIVQFNKLPEATTQKNIAEYFASYNGDDRYIFILPKITNKQQHQAWYKALEKQGVHIPIWPPNLQDSIRILKYKSNYDNLSIDHDAIMLLAHHYEGNLLGASQVIDKVKLSQDVQSIITLDDVKQQLNTSRRYDVFNLVESCLVGDATRILQILENLKKAGIEPSIIIWALAKEARILSKLLMASDRKRQQDIFKTNQIWPAKQKSYYPACQRLTLKRVYTILKYCHVIDLTIKGAISRDIWLFMEQMCLCYTKDYQPLCPAIDLAYEKT